MSESKEPKQLYQIHLKGNGFGGRAVRYRLLTPDEIDQRESMIAEDLGKDATVVQFNKKVAEACLELMIHSFTDPCKPKDLPEAKWYPAPMGSLLERWGEFFNAKDSTFLRKLFLREHGVNDAEMDAIMGERVPVLED